MKKFGFTLAEVLITLGIIGVIAALTTPALISNSQNEANGAKLAVTVSNLENAFQNAMIQEGSVNDIRQTKMWEYTIPDANDKESSAHCLAFVGNLGKYIVLNGMTTYDKVYNSSSIYKLTSSGGKGAATDEVKNASLLPILMKNGAVMFIKVGGPNVADTYSENDAIAKGTALRAEVGQVAIDINGSQGPNTIGRDLFWFTIGQNGILYPVGSRDYATLTSGLAWNEAKSNYNCEDGSIAGDGWGCTARLIEENYKMNY